MNALFNGVFGGWTASWIGNYNSGTLSVSGQIPLLPVPRSYQPGAAHQSRRRGLGVPFDSKKFDTRWCR